MKIHIITMEDPLYTVDFIKAIIRDRHKNITGLTISRGGRLKIGKQRSRAVYLLGLSLIMGIPTFVRYAFQTIHYRLKKKIPILKRDTLACFAERYGIPVDYTGDPNSDEYLGLLKEKAPDVIINQSQFIIKKDLLSLPRLGILNRHNALLPKNRGRLTPFWVLFKKEKETGVSIHFVEKNIDSGPIVVQKRFSVEQNESFSSLVKKNYYWASTAMLEALKKMESGSDDVLPNPDSEATYNSIPTLAQAWEYRKRKFWKLFVE